MTQIVYRKWNRLKEMRFLLEISSKTIRTKHLHGSEENEVLEGLIEFLLKNWYKNKTIKGLWCNEEQSLAAPFDFICLEVFCMDKNFVCELSVFIHGLYIPTSVIAAHGYSVSLQRQFGYLTTLNTIL